MTGYESKRAAAQDKLAQPAQEPVAWMWRCKSYYDYPNWEVSLKRPADSGRDGNKKTDGYEDVPLYTAPPQRTEQCNYPDCKCPTENPCLKGLAQPAQEPVAMLFGSLPVYDTTPPQPAQEPVAWSDEHLQFLNFLYGAGEFDGVWFDQKHPKEKGAFWWRKHLRRLFDAPPQRTWVDLTEEEIDQFHNWKDCTWSTNELVRHVEATLRSKNT